MRGNTARLGKGYFIPVASPDQGGLSCPPWTPRRGIGILAKRHCHIPAKGAFVLPWKPMTAVSAAASTKEPSCPLETRSGQYGP